MCCKSDARRPSLVAELDAGVSPVSGWERSVHDHLDVLCAVALRFTHDVDGAEQLVQDTVARAFVEQNDMPEGTHPKTWLLTTLRRTFLDSKEDCCCCGPALACPQGGPDASSG